MQKVVFTVTFEDGTSNVVLGYVERIWAVYEWARDNDRGTIEKVSYKYLAADLTEGE